MTRDFQQFGILTSVDSGQLVQLPFKLRNIKWWSVGSLTLVQAKALIRLPVLLEFPCCGSYILISFQKEIFLSESKVLISDLLYSKTCVKRPFSKRPKLVFKANYRLMQVKSIAESILQ